MRCQAACCRIPRAAGLNRPDLHGLDRPMSSPLPVHPSTDPEPDPAPLRRPPPCWSSTTSCAQETIRRVLDEEFEVLTASSADEARAILQQQPVAVILCDQRMPGRTGVEFLSEVRETWPDTVRIIVSGYTDSEDIVAGINQAGIHRFVLKPWMPDHLLHTVRQAAEAQSLQQDMHRLDLELRNSVPLLRQRSHEKLAQVQNTLGFDAIVRAPGSPLDPICKLASKLARYDLSILILGESGTGKEMLARAIHYASPRAAGPFVVENCAAVADTLLESELFGHKRGAFTGAVHDHAGLFQRANGGTIFLDEIGDTSLAFQVRRCACCRKARCGRSARRAVPVDVRVIAATHRDLEREVEAGRFREDLYYRIATATLALPPLRERSGDLVPIAHRLLQAIAEHESRPAGLDFARDALAVLLGYAWPGNIRELRNEIYRAVALSDDDLIRADAFSPKVLRGQSGPAARGPEAQIASAGTLQERLDAMETMLIKEALLRHRWNKTRASELGLSRAGLRQKCSDSVWRRNERRFARRHGRVQRAVAAVGRLRRLQHVAAVRRHAGLLRHAVARRHSAAVASVAVAGNRRGRPRRAAGVPRRYRRAACAVRRRRDAARPERHGAFSRAGRHRGADDRLGRPARERRALHGGDRHLRRLRRHHRGRRESGRCLRAAVRRRSAGRAAGRGVPVAQRLPVVNVAGCPTHPDWVVETLSALSMSLLDPAALDTLGRPRFYADQLVHHGCTRNEFYEYKASAVRPSDLGCMMEHMGCKGTQAHADCNTRCGTATARARAAAMRASAARSRASRSPATRSTARRTSPASRSACRATCRRRGSSRSRRCRRPRRRSAARKRDGRSSESRARGPFAAP
jgi:two-component system response regulator HupR/HoxA